MPPASPPAESAPPKAAGGRVAGAVHDVADFWTRVTDGLALNQLWDQFKEEATASYNLYARDVDWSEIPRKKGLRRSLRLSLALFYVMLLKLSPARRILLLLAVAFFMAPGVTIFQPHGKSWDLNGYFEVSAVLLFVLLVLELADRVTMKRDLEIAREIQTWLVPRQPPSVPGIDIAFATQPANTIAGDFYDAFLRPSASPGGEGATLLVAVADVAGKSVPAALLTATFQSGLRTLASTPGSLVDVVDRLDRYACAHSLNGLRFTTAFIAELDPTSRNLAYVNAGHNAPILQHANGSRERLEIGGVPLGVSVESAASHYDVGAVQLAVGDTLVVFTDGVIESLNEAGEEYGESRFLADLKFAPGASAQQILQDILDRAKNFTGAARRHDDITCLVLRVTA